MTNIVGLHGAVPTSVEPDKEIIRLFELMVALARRGDVTAFALTYVDPCHMCVRNNKAHLLLAGSVYLQHRIIGNMELMPIVAPPGDELGD